jgi:HSP20 family protein
MEAYVMSENVTKLPVKRETMEPSFTRGWHPFESLHREIDRLFDDFGMGVRWPFGRSIATEPLFRRELSWPKMPAVDVVESEGGYEITADLPGMEEKNIEIKVTDGVLTMKGERQEEKEEKKRTITCRSAASVRSNVASNCPKVSMQKRSKQCSRRACLL